MLHGVVFTSYQHRIYPYELRSRVVGSRLILAGSPTVYFYKWNSGQPEQLFDPLDIPETRVNYITATPFTLWLYQPLACRPFATARLLWIGFEYLVYGLTMLLALSLATSGKRKTGIAIVFALFVWMVPWRVHIMAGQYYILVPFFALLILFLYKKGGWYHVALGTILVLAVLFRPYVGLIFLPALLFTNRKIILGITAAVITVAVWYWVDGAQVKRTQEFRRATQFWSLQMINQIPQELPAATYQFTHLEGEPLVPYNNRPQIDEATGVQQRLYNHLGVAISPVVLYALFAIVAGLLLIVAFCKKKLKHLPQAVLVGCVLYFLAEILSPFGRPAYNVVQTLLPIALLLAYTPLWSRNKRAGWVLLAGFGLLSGIFYFIKIDISLGEWLIYGACLAIVFNKNPTAGQVEKG